jgi:amidase
MVQTAVELAEAVRSRKLDPVQVTKEALARIEAADGVVGAFRRVRAEEALAEALAVKDVTEIAGEHAEWGSKAGAGHDFDADGVIARRLRAAGAVIVGLTRVPELCIWPMSDTPEGIARNPWEPTYVAGGSSGGSAAAVAAGLVPFAHGTDGLGSIRLPAAMCGLVGIKPGAGVVRESDMTNWYGMSTHGALATTVADAAALLAVLAERPELAEVAEPGKLRVAMTTRVPLTRAPVPKELTAAVHHVAELLRGAGHAVEEATPRYGVRAVGGILARWFAGPAEQAANFDLSRLQPRTRAHVRLGRSLRKAGLIRQRTKQDWTARAEEFFAERDVLITPTLATLPPKAKRWHEKCWAGQRPAVGAGRRVHRAVESRGLPGDVRAGRAAYLRAADRRATGGRPRRRSAIAQPRRPARVPQLLAANRDALIALTPTPLGPP